MRFFSILMLLSLTAGCRTRYMDVNTASNCFRRPAPEAIIFLLPTLKPDYSLYCADGEKAKLKLASRSVAYCDTGWKFYWEKDNGHSLFSWKKSPYSIVKKCKPYIQNDSAEKLTFEQYQSFFESKSVDMEHGHTLRPPDSFGWAFEESLITAEIIDKKHVIICLEPLVVVTLEVENIAWDKFFIYIYSSAYNNFKASQGILLRRPDGFFKEYDLQRQEWKDCSRPLPNGIVLPYGLDHGLELPYVENPRWFSPDMKVEDHPIEMVSEIKGQITVPWGYLYLTKQDDNWVVTAEKK